MLSRFLPIHYLTDRNNDMSFDFSKFIPSIKSDIQDLGDRLKIDMDLPGFTKDQVEVKLENGILCISAVKEVKEDTDKKNYICKERSSTTLHREFNVGTNVTNEDVSAKMENGVLEIEVQKKEQPTEDSIINIK